jgi:hypothetical protein
VSVFFYRKSSQVYYRLIGHLRRCYPYGYGDEKFNGVEKPKRKYLSLSINWADEYLNNLRNIKLLHRFICNGVLSEIDLLEKKPIEEYAQAIDAYKYELHLKEKSAKKS